VPDHDALDAALEPLLPVVPPPDVLGVELVDGAAGAGDDDELSDELVELVSDFDSVLVSVLFDSGLVEA
jgi:hypothetical protein